MKTIGLLGGMTCESSAVYYRLINNFTRIKLGGIHSAKSVMVSVDFGYVRPFMETGEWNKVSKIMVETATSIEKGGADCLVICTNTIHKFAELIEQKIKIPLLNIIDTTAQAIKNKNTKKVGLLGTSFTMEEDFYKKRLKDKHEINTIIPLTDEIKIVHQIIMDELSIGIIKQSSKEIYWKIINNLVNRGAEGIILGCTEIPLLVFQEEGEIPLYDTTAIHAQAAVDYANS